MNNTFNIFHVHTQKCHDVSAAGQRVNKDGEHFNT